MLISSVICHQGLIRAQNEDSVLCNVDEGIFLVADGVGGNTGGDVASQLAVQAVERKLRQGVSLTMAIKAANESILSTVSQQEDLQGMATTLVAVKLTGNSYELAWIGDSRAYLLDSGEIHLLSSDHNVANELYLRGEIQKQDIQGHSGQHELTQALGQLSLNDIPTKKGKLSSGSILLLCSDGLSGVLNERIIRNTILTHSSLDAASQALLGLVLEAGAPDNVTITLIQFVDDKAEQVPSLEEVVHKKTVKFR